MSGINELAAEACVLFLAGLPAPFTVDPNDAAQYEYRLRRACKDHGWQLDQALADYLTRDSPDPYTPAPASVLRERLSRMPDAVVIRYEVLKETMEGLPRPTTVDGLAGLLSVGLELDELQAQHHLCISCGLPTAPLRNAFGVTGYTHDRWRGGWEGQRCPGSITGAEPVQKPARVLLEVASKRALLDEALGWKHLSLPGMFGCATARFPDSTCTCDRDERVTAVLQHLAAPYQGAS
jgi:hypothetical protein